jgi:lysyl-tRNA synthetase class I
MLANHTRFIFLSTKILTYKTLQEQKSNIPKENSVGVPYAAVCQKFCDPHKWFLHSLRVYVPRCSSLNIDYYFISSSTSFQFGSFLLLLRIYICTIYFFGWNSKTGSPNIPHVRTQKIWNSFISFFNRF